MHYNDSWCLQGSNAVNERLWDTHGVEIEACTILSYFAGSGNILELLILKLVAGGQPRKVSKLGLSNILK